ncbi:dienelactone hydrolase family protein [Streptomyces sp. NPDC091377]|uniref:dienelactone hydrolase family protein n=1 Tax=unclassified Streptomyces TaxID=2593676 RepID=UPI0038126AB9
MTAVQGSTVDLPTEDGVADAYVTRPAGGGPYPGVLMFPDAFGPRPGLRAMADRLAGAGYAVLVPNVLYRHGRAPVVELPGFIDLEARPGIFERLVPMMRALTPDLAMRDAAGYLRRLAEDPGVADGPVAVTGYCMGARLALLTAGTHPERVAAVAGFHGAALAPDSPDGPHRSADRITAEVYFGHADNDPSMPPDQVERLERALTEAGVRHTCEVYEGARHGFTQADTSVYDAQADARHWAALLDLLGRTF